MFKKFFCIYILLTNIISAHSLVNISFDNNRIVQGDAVWIKIKTAKEISSGSIKLNTNSFKIFKKVETKESSEYFYLSCIGISRYLKPQQTELNFKFNFTDGSSYQTKLPIQISSANFKKENIKLSPKKTKINQNKKARSSETKVISNQFNTVSQAKKYSGAFIWPVNGKITSEFGTTRMYNNKPGWMHSGIDISENTGHPILASQSGKIILAKKLTIHGNTIMIDHGWGIISIYNHLDKISKKLNDTVTKGEQIGTVGSTGVATGSHLHFGISIQSVRVNPRHWIEKSSTFNI